MAKRAVKDCSMCVKYLNNERSCRITGECNPVPCGNYIEDILKSHNKKITKQLPKIKKPTRVRRKTKEVPKVCKTCAYFFKERKTCKTAGYVYDNKCDCYERVVVSKEVKHKNEVQKKEVKQLELF